MAYRQIPTGRLANLVGEQLRESIFDGRYKPGEKMPTEQQLTEMFGVSRVIVREAVRNLELAGLVEIRRGPKGGAFVVPMRHEAVSQMIKDLLRLGKARVADIMEVRLEMEPIVAALASLRRTDEDMEELSRAVKGMPEAPGDEYVAWNVDFHRLLATCSHNPIYEILINILMDITEELILNIKPADRVIHDMTSHSEICELVRQGNSDGACIKMRSHLEDVVPVLREMEEKSSGLLVH
ncbi:MAG: FadR family transcriptional regulator [Deltaproteobacteria bacterium]|nr:FadR family transcriptional regulator [Deltaproteobacteria bacterium]